MDSQFKQRLTGAVILVLLAVVLVPELLTGPKPHPTGPTSSTVAPGDGAPLRSYDIDLSDSPQVAVPAESQAPAAGSAAATVRSGRSEAAASTASDRPAPRPEAPAEPIAPEAASSPTPASAADRVAPDAKAAPQAALRGFAVQVGSFASKSSADRLASDLARRRFETFVSPVRSSGRQLFRVRVGPVGDREAAQALVNRLKAAGQKGSVVPLP